MHVDIWKARSNPSLRVIRHACEGEREFLRTPTTTDFLVCSTVPVKQLVMHAWDRVVIGNATAALIN